MRVIKDERCFQRQVKVVEIPNIRIISLTQDSPGIFPLVASLSIGKLQCLLIICLLKCKKPKTPPKQKPTTTTTNKTKTTKTRDKTTFSGVIKLCRVGAS